MQILTIIRNNPKAVFRPESQFFIDKVWTGSNRFRKAMKTYVDLRNMDIRPLKNTRNMTEMYFLKKGLPIRKEDK